MLRQNILHCILWQCCPYALVRLRQQKKNTWLGLGKDQVFGYVFAAANAVGKCSEGLFKKRGFVSSNILGGFLTSRQKYLLVITNTAREQKYAQFCHLKQGWRHPNLLSKIMGFFLSPQINWVTDLFHVSSRSCLLLFSFCFNQIYCCCVPF